MIAAAVVGWEPARGGGAATWRGLQEDPDDRFARFAARHHIFTARVMGGIVATRKWLPGAGAGALVVAISLAFGAADAASASSALGIASGGKSPAASNPPAIPPGAVLFTAAPAPTAQSRTTGGTAAAVTPAVVNPAGCYVQVDDPHMSDTVSNAVKVNARIAGCSFPADTLRLSVQLWKTGFFTDYLQAQTTTNATYTGYLRNYDTYVKCTNTKASTSYGTADGTIYLAGTVYTASVYSVHVFNAPSCGT